MSVPIEEIETILTAWDSVSISGGDDEGWFSSYRQEGACREHAPPHDMMRLRDQVRDMERKTPDAFGESSVNALLPILRCLIKTYEYLTLCP